MPISRLECPTHVGERKRVKVMYFGAEMVMIAMDRVRWQFVGQKARLMSRTLDAVCLRMLTN